MMERRILTVAQLNTYLKQRFDADGLLADLCVRGELSNYKLYPSGHHYFTLKDNEASIRCVMFKSSAASLRFRPENGMAVLAIGRVTVYPRDGAYQLYCTRLTPEGLGDLHLAFEQLKQKLAGEGLFDQQHKKPLPAYPHRIAIITSSAGAAIHDMLRILGKRYPLSKVLLLPVRVQGPEAPPEIASAIRYANRWKLADLIITGRGGGSIEELWAFNDERVARAIYESEIPVVSAVGHEPDVTISDFVADLRAATPSNAAELAAPDRLKLQGTIQSLQAEMTKAIQYRLQSLRERLERLRTARVLQSPQNYLQDKRLRLDAAQQRLLWLTERLLNEKKQRFSALTSGLDAMSPLKVLSRGYSVVYTADGKLVCSAADVLPGDPLTIQTGNGRIHAAVQSTEQENQNGTAVKDL